MRWIACLVPFCEGGFTAPDSETANECVCPDHKRLIDRRIRNGGVEVDHRVWQHVRRQVIERAAGIA